MSKAPFMTYKEECESLREQVEKLTKERDIKEHCIVQLEAEDLRMKEQLAALAEQNEKLRKALTKWQYLNASHNFCCGYCGNELSEGHRDYCALSLPDLASPVLNRIRAEENEAIIAAANALENIASTSSSTRIRRVANEALKAIRARRNHG